MTELSFLKDLVVIFVAAVLVVALLRRIQVPSIAGFILAGVLVGPNAFGLVDDVHRVEILAEVGVILLLFGIGLELSLERIRRLWRAVLIGGAFQVAATVGATFAVARSFGIERPAAFFLGCIVAVSSTAIVLRGLAERGDLDTPHGRLALGILVFQDLCVVPMILAIPFLAGDGGSGTEALIALLIAVGVLLGVLLGARTVVPRLLQAVSRTRQRDLFVLSVFMICLGTAWAVSNVGISLALGAFLAGLIVAGGEFRHQALSDLMPLREVLASTFFVSIGMLLDAKGVLEHAGPIAALVVTILLGKFMIVFLTASVMRLPIRVCVLTGAALAQVGEFSFVLFRSAAGTPLLIEPLASNLLVAVILSMLVTPIAIALGPHLAAGAGRLTWFNRLLQVKTPEDAIEEQKLDGHIVIAGYGLTGQRLACALKAANTPFVIVDLNLENVRLAAERRDPVYFGDITSLEVMEHLGVERAREMVIAINDADASERAVRAVRRVAPELLILARARYATDVEQLRRAGASEVVVAEVEAAVEISSLLLGRLGIDRSTMEQQICDIRYRAGYTVQTTDGGDQRTRDPQRCCDEPESEEAFRVRG